MLEYKLSGFLKWLDRKVQICRIDETGETDGIQIYHSRGIETKRVIEIATCQLGEKLIIELGGLENMSLASDIQYVGIKGTENFQLRINKGLSELLVQYITCVQWDKQGDPF